MKHAGNALKYLSLLFMFVAFPYQNAVAQNGNVKGTVVADDGPVIGATVRVKGQPNMATVTDLDGNFTLKAPKGATLQISYLGYKDKEVKVGNGPIDVTLVTDAQALSEVVVVGYGQMKRADLTGSVASVGEKAIEKSVATSIDQVALEGAMDAWVSGVANHLKEKNVVPFGYDVINEPIADGSNGRRGYDGVFGMEGDSEPTESEADGLSLNWESGHWYWGYYVKDYPVKAFQLARKYLPADTKLFVNDYNLETSPKKLEALIKFAKEIDEKNGSPIVDGIGTQMHVTLNCSDDAEKNAEAIAALKAQVDAMFQTMAATGKLVRVTELDLSLGTGTPSSNQYKAQSDAYRMIVESYKANVPEPQQSGITIWSLSDNEAEHEYWLKGQVPNLFDKDYKRKWAYKGFCDGIAGEDLGLKYGGEEYKAFYEKNNVSSTVDK